MEQEKSPAPTKGNIYKALSALQKELKPMARTVEVDTGKYKYSYTPLDEIMKTLYPLVGKHGLSVRHELTEKGMECVLAHDSGEELRSGAIEVPRSGSMQAIGGAITYARRYTLTMLLGIASEEDTDVKGLEVPSKAKTMKDEAQQLDITAQVEKLKACKTLTELKQTWTGFAPAYRENVELMRLKDDIKGFMQEEEREAPEME